MSGSSTALILTAASAALSLAALFDGEGALLLGEMEFSGFELPESISYGGTQKMTTHMRPGGVKTIDVMADDDADISWSGIFMDPFASDRAMQLEQMRRDGDVVTLAWGMFVYDVIVKEASFESHARRNHYRVTCTVLPDPDPDDDPDGDDGSTGPGNAPSSPSAASEMGNGGLGRAGVATTPDTPTPALTSPAPATPGPAGLLGQI